MISKRDDGLAGKVALISGGASGIGQALAISYARAGVHSVVNYLDSDPHDPQETVRLVEAEGGKCIAVPADVRSSVDCAALADVAIETFGRLDIAGSCWDLASGTSRQND